MLFVIASGITLLQVAANPYVAVVGKPETASSRLNLVQAMNSAGTMLAPMFGAYLILGRSKGGTAQGEVVLTQAERLADAQSVILPYVLVAIVLGFTQSFNLGVSLLFGSMFFAAFMLWLFVRFVPDSPIGKLVFLKKSAKEWDGFETANKTLLGKTGISCTMLRPSGMAVIDDERIDVVTEGEMIQKDQPIKVIEIEGNRIVVAIDHSNDP